MSNQAIPDGTPVRLRLSNGDPTQVTVMFQAFSPMLRGTHNGEQRTSVGVICQINIKRKCGKTDMFFACSLWNPRDRYDRFVAQRIALKRTVKQLYRNIIVYAALVADNEWYSEDEFYDWFRNCLRFGAIQQGLISITEKSAPQFAQVEE